MDLSLISCLAERINNLAERSLFVMLNAMNAKGAQSKHLTTQIALRTFAIFLEKDPSQTVQGDGVKSLSG